MTARQQLARLLPLVLLLALVVAGLRGVVPPPRWNGPLKADGVAVGLGLEVVFAAALTAVLVRGGRARRDAERRSAARRAAQAVARAGGTSAEPGLEPAEALRFALRYVLAAAMIAVAVVLLSNLHLHYFTRPRPAPAPSLLHRPSPPPARPRGSGGWTVHLPVDSILYGLLVVAIVAAVAVSLWWAARLRRPAAPLRITDVTSAQELREAVAEGRAALAGADDARAAIIACYVAMERSLADRGTARGAAGTPDELLARAVAAGTVKRGAAGRLTALFYEARFSTHPLGPGQRDAASAALDELTAELDQADARRAAATAAGAAAAGAAAAGADADGAAAGNAAASAGQRPPGPA